MLKFAQSSFPDEVGRETLDPGIANWLETAPRLGAHEPVRAMSRAHRALVPEDPPPIGGVEHLGLSGPHGTIPVRVYHPSSAPNGAALIYPHGGGWTVGALDEFEGAMRIFAKESKAQIYAVEYRLAPEHQYPV